MRILRPCVPAALGRRLASSSAFGARKRTSQWGFREHDFDRQWFLNVEALRQSELLPPGAVLTAMPYAYFKGEGQSDESDLSPPVESARKYSFFGSHEAWWDYMGQCERAGKHHSFNEVFEPSSPRCLYFDLDGHPSYKGSHEFIVELLQKYVRSFFLGDKLGWESLDPHPVVLQSHQEEKYSCHVVFPQIQFEKFEQQQEYIPWILRNLGKMVVDVEGGQERLLEKLVDRAPYRSFQLLRGPFACKMKPNAKELLPSSRFEPQEYFRNDELTCFAGHVDPDYALQIPSIDEILQSNKELLEIDHDHQEAQSRQKDNPALFAEQFQQRHCSDFLDLAGLTELERYQVLLSYLGDDRANDWSTWWYVSAITCHMLQKHDHSEQAQAEIWQAHCRWSSRSWKFDENENWQRVVKASQAPRLPGLRGLTRLVQHDYPLMKVRERLWPFQMPKRPESSQFSV